jgi:hypothetical protein
MNDNVKTFKAKKLESKMRGGIEFRKRGGGGYLYNIRNCEGWTELAEILQYIKH